MTKRTLKNKQFNIHKKGGKINEKHNVRVAFVENTVMASLIKIRLFTRVCVCVCLNVNRVC